MSDRVGALDAEPPALTARVRESGVRSTAIVIVASIASIIANYVFLLAAGRILGSEDYGSLAALLGLLAVVLMPAGALQMAVSREVSRREAAGDREGAAAFTRRTVMLSLIATVPLVAVALALAAPLAAVLNIESTGVVALALGTLVSTFVYPVAMGVLQGEHRFHALAWLYAFPFPLRLALLAVVAVAGYRLGGAIFVTFASALVGTGLAIAIIWEPLRRGARLPRPDLRPFLRYLAPVTVGLVGIALLTHVDILIVKARFPSDEAGAYGAASAFARVAFFLPATILAVLFPRTAARHVRGEETKDILGRSLIATAAFCGSLALLYWAAGVGLVVTTFGRDFAEGGEVLAPFALAIGLYSLANILVGYHLSRGETRYAWMVAAAVVVQVIVLALVPSTLGGLVWANVAVAAALLAAHELAIGSSLPALRTGALHLLPNVGARVRAVGGEAVLVLFGLTAFVCALFWRVVTHLGSTVIGVPGSDSTGTVSWLWQIRHESGFHLLGTTHHTMTGAPLGWDEGNGLNVQWSLPYYPAYLAAKVVGDVAALNLVVLSGYVLTGAAIYLVARVLGCRPLVAVWAALAAVVFPWHLARAEHASLLHVEVIVLLVLALVAAARSTTMVRCCLVGVATLACWLTSGYYGAIAVVTTGAFTLGAALVSGRRRVTPIIFGAVVPALAATAIVLLASTASGVGRGAGLHRVPEDLSTFGLRPLELVVPPTDNIVLGDSLDSFWDARDHGSNATERANYLGIVTIGFALAWIALAVRRRRSLSPSTRVVTAGLASTFVMGLLFASPSPIQLFGHELSMPARLLWEVTSAFRVPSRWDPLLMTAAVLLAALGIQALVRALPRGVGRGALPVTAVGVLIVLSFLELSISPAKAHFRTVPVPPEYLAVERTPPGVLAEYPLGYSDIYRLWQRHHGRPLLNGAPQDTPADEVRLVLLDPAERGTPEALSLLGVTAVAIHPGARVDTEVDPREPAGDRGYELVGRFPDGASVWRVVAPPAPALATLPLGGFAKPKRQADGFVGYALVSPAGVGEIVLRAKESSTVRLTFDAEPHGDAGRVLRIADVEREQEFTLAARTRVSVLVAIPRGESRLLVKTDPPATSEEDAILISAPRTQRAAGTPTLRAEPISADPGF